MLDLRSPDAATHRIDDALRCFERGGSVPIRARDLLIELADALADSGPLELGVSAQQWLDAQATARRVLESPPSDGTAAHSRQAKRALRRLRPVFGQSARSARLRAAGVDSARVWAGMIALSVLLVICDTVLGEAAGHGHFQSLDFWPVILTLPLSFFCLIGPVLVVPMTWATQVNVARSLAAEIAPGERLLHSFRVAGGKHAGSVVIATDERIQLVEPAHKGEPPQTHWSTAYVRIVGFRSKRKGSEQRYVTLLAEGRTFSIRFEGESQGVDELALLAILHRRAKVESRSGRAKTAPAIAPATWRNSWLARPRDFVIAPFAHPWLRGFAVIAPLAAGGVGAGIGLASWSGVGLASSSAVFLPKSETFPLPASTDATAPQISRIVVSNDSDGLVTFRVDVPNRPKLTSSLDIGVDLDTDRNGHTGDPQNDGVDYEIDLNSSGVALGRWTGSDWNYSDQSPISLSYTYGSGATFRIAAADLGLNKRSPGFNFYAYAASGNRESQQPPAGHVPDLWTYELRYAAEQPASGTPAGDVYEHMSGG